MMYNQLVGAVRFRQVASQPRLAWPPSLHAPMASIIACTHGFPPCMQARVSNISCNISPKIQRRVEIASRKFQQSFVFQVLDSPLMTNDDQ